MQFSLFSVFYEICQQAAKQGEDEENGVDIEKHAVNTHDDSEAEVKVLMEFSHKNNKWKSLVGEK